MKNKRLLSLLFVSILLVSVVCVFLRPPEKIAIAAPTDEIIRLTDTTYNNFTSVWDTTITSSGSTNSNNYTAWAPSNPGNYPYTIYIQDNIGNWRAISGSIKVNQAAPSPEPDILLWLLSLILIGTVLLTFIIYIKLNKKIQKLSTAKPLPQKDLPKKPQS